MRDNTIIDFAVYQLCFTVLPNGFGRSMELYAYAGEYIPECGVLDKLTNARIRSSIKWILEEPDLMDDPDAVVDLVGIENIICCIGTPMTSDGFLYRMARKYPNKAIRWQWITQPEDMEHDTDWTAIPEEF
jgi:hypothetical protein